MDALTIPGRNAQVCTHHAAYLARNGDREQYGVYCDDCRRWVTQAKLGTKGLWLKLDHEQLRGKDLRRLPVVGVEIYRQCEGPCKGMKRTQLHHFGCRAFFGDEADEWPVAYLCETCHTTWHAKVTPGLCTPYDPDYHATMLVGTLGVEPLRDLWRSVKGKAA